MLIKHLKKTKTKTKKNYNTDVVLSDIEEIFKAVINGEGKGM